VESTLVEPGEAPLQGDEGAPDAWLVLDPAIVEGLRGLQAGTDVLVLTWLHRASREVLALHPRGDTQRPTTGVFNTRSQDRPNPIGLHRVTILAIDGNRIRVRDLDAVDQTPILDVKPVLEPIGER
jgi:tRNA-Thr(GGU) m(6)t(6)A37 methyltransferase TsaA